MPILYVDLPSPYTVHNNNNNNNIIIMIINSLLIEGYTVS